MIELDVPPLNSIDTLTDIDSSIQFVRYLIIGTQSNGSMRSYVYTEPEVKKKIEQFLHADCFNIQINVQTQKEPFEKENDNE